MAMIGLRKEVAIKGKQSFKAQFSLRIHHTNTMLENILENVPAVTNPDNHIRPVLRKT